MKVKVHKYIESAGFYPVEQKNNIEIEKYVISGVDTELTEGKSQWY